MKTSPVFWRNDSVKSMGYFEHETGRIIFFDPVDISNLIFTVNGIVGTNGPVDWNSDEAINTNGIKLTSLTAHHKDSLPIESQKSTEVTREKNATVTQLELVYETLQRAGVSSVLPNGVRVFYLHDTGGVGWSEIIKPEAVKWFAIGDRITVDIFVEGEPNE